MTEEPRVAKPASAREVALDLLSQVLDRGRPLDELLENNPRLAALEPRDRAFARLMVATVLRRLGQIDALLNHCLERPLDDRAAATRSLLRLGVCQLLFLGVPAHAAVDQSVEIAATVDRGGFRKLVNAVLRRLAGEGPALIESQDAARLNTPDWLWQSWSAAYGEPTCRAIAEAHLVEPPLDLTVKDDAQAWAQRLGGELLPTGSLRRPAGGDIRALDGFEEGAWWVQDAAAALPARLFGAAAGRRIIDLCAAPGGKTAQLAAMGAEVTALDRSAGRLKRVGANLKRLGLSAALVAADAGMWRPDVPADGVLLDAPCSSTGTIRRHPDVARLKTPEDVARLVVEQDRLLAAAIEMLRPGGTLIFTTCSLQPEEGPQRIAALLKSNAPLVRRPIERGEFDWPPELVTPAGDLRTLPCHLAERGGLDGFYAARLERV